MKPNRPTHYQNGCEELRDLLPAYMIGASDSEEAARVRELLPQCPDVASEMGDYAQVTLGLMQQVPTIAPPADLRERILLQAARSDSVADADIPPPLDLRQSILDKAEETPKSSEVQEKIIRPSFRYAAWGSAAALLVLLLATNVYWAGRVNEIRDELALLRDQENRVIDLLAESAFEQVALQSTSDDSFLATVLYLPNTNELALLTNNLPTLDATETYQVWLIGDDAPVSAGLFQSDVQNRAIFNFADDTNLADFEAVAISIEPSGGSPAPTTDPIALASIGF